jgi:membrane fusion protein (multidrug efflux system)
MYVRTIVQEGVVDQAILVPQQSVSRNPKGNPFVLLVGAEVKVEQRMIEVDRAIGDRWLVASGLAPGDRVIVEGIQKVRPGVSVKTIPFTPGGKESPEAAKTGQPATGAK